MKLTKKQIENLYAFTKKHHVEWYDLQTELVDHLANDIEQIWQENPKLTFEQVKNQSFKKFGIFGFGDIIEKKQNELTKHYWSLTWQIFKDYFKLPKIILTAFLIILSYLIIDLFNNKNLLITIYFSILGITPLIIVVYRGIKLKKNKKVLIKNGCLRIQHYLLVAMRTLCKYLYNYLLLSLLLNLHKTCDYSLQLALSLLVLYYLL